jgi:hypothetical protein
MAATRVSERRGCWGEHSGGGLEERLGRAEHESSVGEEGIGRKRKGTGGRVERKSPAVIE